MGSSTANVPMIETGTATSGISVVRSLPRNRKTTMRNKDDGDDQRANDFRDGRRDEDRGVEEYGVGEVVGKTRRQRVHGVAHLLGHIDSVGSWRLVDPDRGGRSAVDSGCSDLAIWRPSRRGRRH